MKNKTLLKWLCLGLTTAVLSGCSALSSWWDFDPDSESTEWRCYKIHRLIPWDKGKYTHPFMWPESIYNEHLLKYGWTGSIMHVTSGATYGSLSRRYFCSHLPTKRLFDPRTGRTITRREMQGNPIPRTAEELFDLLYVTYDDPGKKYKRYYPRNGIEPYFFGETIKGFPGKDYEYQKSLVPE